jgi:hypothetical protein
MENLIIYEKVLIKRAIENEIENLEAEMRVKNKDLLLLNCDEDYFENMVGLTLEIEDLEQKIFDYKEIIKKLELGE